MDKSLVTCFLTHGICLYHHHCCMLLVAGGGLCSLSASYSSTTVFMREFSLMKCCAFLAQSSTVSSPATTFSWRRRRIVGSYRYVGLSPSWAVAYPTALYAIARICHGNSFCLSVPLPSVRHTRDLYTKTAERIIKILSLSDRPIIPGLLHKSNGFTRNMFACGPTPYIPQTAETTCTRFQKIFIIYTLNIYQT